MKFTIAGEYKIFKVLRNSMTLKLIKNVMKKWKIMMIRKMRRSKLIGKLCLNANLQIRSSHEQFSNTM